MIQTVTLSSLLSLLMPQLEVVSTMLRLDKDPIRCMLLGCASQVLKQRSAQHVSNVVILGWQKYVLTKQKGLSGSPEESFVWYATLTVRFFGLLELKPSYEVHNSADIRYDFPKFDSLWKNLTSRLIARATSSSSKVKYYAAEAVPWTTFQNIYALMQCNPLISLGQCNICLRQCVSDYVSCCHGKQGGIVYRPSCAFRSEIYPFFEAFNLTSAPPPTSLSPSVGQRTNTTKRGKFSYIVPWFKKGLKHYSNIWFMFLFVRWRVNLSRNYRGNYCSNRSYLLGTTCSSIFCLQEDEVKSF